MWYNRVPHSTNAKTARPKEYKSAENKLIELVNTPTTYMTNLTKEQLLEKDEAGLQDIAQQLNVKDIEGKSKENLIYDILDAQAEQTAGKATPVKRRPRLDQRHEDDHII